MTGPDGRTVTLNAPEGATQQQIEAKVLELKKGWTNLPPPDLGTTAPEEHESISGPKRPTFSDVDLRAKDKPYASRDQVEFARQSLPAMDDVNREKTLNALALNRANKLREIGADGGPASYGVTGVVAPHLWDKGVSYLDDKLHDLTDGATGQPYDEAVRTRRIMRDRNFEENPVLTAVTGTGAALALPAAKVFSNTSRAGFMGNTALTAGGYGTVHGAGAGEGFDEGLQGAATEGGLGLTFGLVLGKLMQIGRAHV